MTARQPQLLATDAHHALPLFLAALVVVFLLSIYPRVAQYREWQESPERFFSRGVPVAGTDSYVFFRYAKHYQEGVEHTGHDPLRHFPDGYEYTPVTALSTIMATVSKWTSLDIYQAGIWITIVASSLFVFPLGLYLFRLGCPLAGIWGALVGSFGINYYLRTTIARVDTDGGNLFFLWLVSLIILEVGLHSSRHRSLATAILAGLCLNAFSIWYPKPGFVVAFGGSFVLYLAARRSDPKNLLLLSAVFLLAANPLSLYHAASDLQEFALRYGLARSGDPTAKVAALQFPSVIAEISELRRTSFLEGLDLASGHTAVGVLGLLGFVFFAMRRPVETIPLLPLLSLAFLGIVRAQRFLMYLGPFLGIGCGWLITLALRSAWQRIGGLASIRPARSGALACLIGVAPLPVLLLAPTFFDFPQPRITVELLSSLQRIGDQLPPKAAIVHTWSHGYLITALSGAATFNDGKDPDPVIEQLVDRGLTDADPRVLHDLSSFIAAHGRAGVDAAIEQRQTYPALLESMTGSDPPADLHLYVLLTQQMQREFGNTWHKGRWNFETNSGPREGYDVRSCETMEEILRCSKANKKDILVDPNRGFVNGRAPIARFLRVVAGEVVEERVYPHTGAMWMQLIESQDGGAHELHILKSVVFQSNFNQMYVLGRFDPTRFRMVFDEFPVARLYEVLPTAPSDP